MNQNLKQLIQKYLGDKKYKDFSNRGLADLIVRKESLKVTVDYLRHEISKLKKHTTPLEKVAIAELKEQASYEVFDNQYHFKGSKGSFSLTIEFIDNLFYEYSEYGLKKSQTEIINKYNMEIWQWNSIKSALWLYKKSHIFSPYTAKNTPQDELDQMISAKMDKMISNIGYQVEVQYEKALLKKYKKIIEKDAQREVEIQTIINEVRDLLPQLGFEVELRRTAAPEQAGEISIHIFDIHYGAENRNKNLSPFSPAIVEEYLDEIAQKVNSLSSYGVTVFFGGDLIESFSGMNHPDSWKGLAQGYYGANLITQCYKALVKFIAKIDNVKAVVGVSGNHDRASENNKNETEGFIAEIIFEFLRISLPKEIEVIFDPYVITHEVDGICHIMTHGHFKIVNMTAANMILKFGNPKIFNLLSSGHFHERKIKHDDEQFREIVCPSLLPGNLYSFREGYSTQPGYTIVRRDRRTNKPEILDCPL